MNTRMEKSGHALRWFAIGMGVLLVIAFAGAAWAIELPDSDRYAPQEITIQNYRAHDARGINVFENPKMTDIEYDGFKVLIGAAFTQQYQMLDHKNNPDTTGLGPGASAVMLKEIGNGYNNAVANLYVDAQLARGIYVANTVYWSSRHHREAWVKDGFLLVDGSPIENETLDAIMEIVTLKIGHFEINYGDAHFRRTDNGQAMYNPFVGNLIMDAFNTEVGAEVYARKNGWMGMFGITNGEIRGRVDVPDSRAASYLFKAGYDGMVNDQTRVRLTGSLYTTEKSVSNALYSGDRAGSRYYFVLENTGASESGNFRSGRFSPNMRDKVTAWVINPFVEWNGLEVFGNIEMAKGRASNETEDREATQYAGEAVYRFLQNQLYVGGRYNTVESEMPGMTDKIKINRTQIGAGWFVTPNILLKGEYVKQEHKDYPASSIFAEGEFDGLMVEGVVSF